MIGLWDSLIPEVLLLAALSICVLLVFRLRKRTKGNARPLLVLATVCSLILCIGLCSLCIFRSLKAAEMNRITGKLFLPGRPVEIFYSSISFHGDGCSVEIYKVPNRLKEYFANPSSNFFTCPTKPWPRDNWYVQRWTTGIPASEEASFIESALNVASIPFKDKLTKSLLLETSHYAYIAPQKADGLPPNFDLYILDPVNGWLIILKYDS